MKKAFWSFMGLCLLLLIICCVVMYFFWPFDSTAGSSESVAYLSALLAL